MPLGGGHQSLPSARWRVFEAMFRLRPVKGYVLDVFSQLRESPSNDFARYGDEPDSDREVIDALEFLEETNGRDATFDMLEKGNSLRAPPPKSTKNRK